MKRTVLAFAALLLTGVPAAAQEIPLASDNAPVEISAAHGLEWNRKAKTYTASGDVVAKKGVSEIHSDALTAFYNDAEGGTDISKLNAHGQVVISSPPYTAYGDEAVYDVKAGTAVLTGKGLKVEAAGERLTARDRIEYDAPSNKMTAVGDATAVKATQTLRADTLTAFFGKDAEGKMTARKIEANGNIVITTAAETVTGDQGVYDVPAGQAVLTGRVRIAQGKNVLEGTRATVDMNTGISHLFADNGNDQAGRVTGVFYPKDQGQ